MGAPRGSFNPRDSAKLRPWLIYLVVDPTTGPTNHPRGTVFYVGSRLDLAEPVDVRDLTAPESIPAAEAPARDRLQALVDDGVDVILEFVADTLSYGLRGVESTLGHTIGTLVAAMHPRPLNVRNRGILWDASLAMKVADPTPVDLPAEAIIHRSRGRVPLAELALMSQDAVFDAEVAAVEGLRHTARTAKTLADAGPMPLLFNTGGLAEPHYKLPVGFVLGAWMVKSIDPDPEREGWWQVTRDDDVEASAALQRHYVHRVVDTRSSSPEPGIRLL